MTPASTPFNPYFYTEMNRFGIMGCGGIGKRHIALLDADSRAELVAVWDKYATALSTRSVLNPDLKTSIFK